MPEPRMTGTKTMSEEQRARIWELHVVYSLPSGIIGKRMGLSQKTISNYLKQRREAEGVTVKVKRYDIVRPIV